MVYFGLDEGVCFILINFQYFRLFLQVIKELHTLEARPEITELMCVLSKTHVQVTKSVSS